MPKINFNQAKEFLNNITSEDKVAVVHHDDGDGFCSGILLYDWCKKKEAEVKTFTFSIGKSKAKEYDLTTRFIELAGEINDRMPEYVVQLVQDALNRDGKSLKGARVLILGVAYKKDIDDWRESPALKIIQELRTKEAKVEYNDPYISKLRVDGGLMKSIPLDAKSLRKPDCLVIATDHSAYDYKQILGCAKLIVDTRNATRATVGQKKVIKI